MPVIDRDQMMRVLVEACPSFRREWEAFRAEWKDSTDDLPLYIALAALARHLIGMLERGERDGLARAFGAVEQLQLEGEPCVREAAVIGLLENLQNLNLHATTDPDQLRPFLGPESAEAWDELYGFWQKVGEIKAAGVLEPVPGLSPRLDPGPVHDPRSRRERGGGAKPRAR